MQIDQIKRLEICTISNILKKKPITVQLNLREVLFKKSELWGPY